MAVHFWWVLLILLVVIAAALEKPRRARRSGLDRPWPLEPVAMLLSEPEQALFHRLVEALPHCLVFPQVQLLQVLRFRRHGRDRGLQNRFSQLSVDFLIVRPDTSIVGAVELDDSSHRRALRQDADARKAHALASAGIPLVRWSVARVPDVTTIRAAFDTGRSP
jgi:hypothetical protein